MRKRERNATVLAVQKWFQESVTYEGEPYEIDYEQAAAVADESFNTIVVARAGSGKTRTLIAKIVYLVARCGVKPDEIMAFVFNANAAKEINERLSKMRVNGKMVIKSEGRDNATCNEGNNVGVIKIASTFHAFAREIVFRVCREEEKCGKILAGEKEKYIFAIVSEMMRFDNWRRKICRFVKNNEDNEGMQLGEDELKGFAGMMAIFVNRAQQKYLSGEISVNEAANRYLASHEVDERERLFIELGIECFRRYHWHLIDNEHNLVGFCEYGTDFNLIVSWASKMIESRRKEIVRILIDKRYLLIDEYQDFSQLFLAVILAIRSVAKEVRLFVVGDDWQAINRFAGSDVEYFKSFEKYFGGVADGDGGATVNSCGVNKCAKFEITTNYRCDRLVVATARRFMKKSMGENGQFRAFSRANGKVLIVNPRETEVGYALVPYDLRISVKDRIMREATERMGARAVKKTMVKYLKTVTQVIESNLKYDNILILHRNNETNIGGVSLAGFRRGLMWGLDRLGILSEKEFDERVQIMTMHKSKGLEADVVIILEVDVGVIPKTHPDTALYGLFGETQEVALDDQKRLFYVAMTRAKHRLYIMSESGGFVKYLGKGIDKW